MDKPVVGLACIKFDKAFWGFQESQYQDRVRSLNDLGEKAGFSVKAVRSSFESAEQAIEAAKELNASADLVILDVAAFPEGKAFGVFVDQIAKPLAVWSRAEKIHQTNVAHNSFCGGNFVISNVRLTGRKARFLYGETSEKDFQNRLATAVSLIRAAKRASGNKIGLVGEGIVPKFYDIDIEAADREALERRFGIRFVNIATDDVVARAKSWKDSEAAQEAEQFTASFSSVEIPRESVLKLARYRMAMRAVLAEEDFASVAIRCWPELQIAYGIWPCSILSLLNEEGMPTACEGDPGGALDMLLASKMADGPSTLMDIIDWQDTKNQFSIWHCGPTAPSWAVNRKTRLMNHNVDGATAEGKPAYGDPAIVDMTFAGGPVTIFRTLGALDDEFVLQGDLIEDPEAKICGSFGSVASPSMYGTSIDNLNLRAQIFGRALPHHYTAVRGHLFNR